MRKSADHVRQHPACDRRKSLLRTEMVRGSTRARTICLRSSKGADSSVYIVRLKLSPGINAGGSRRLGGSGWESSKSKGASALKLRCSLYIGYLQIANRVETLIWIRDVPGEERAGRGFFAALRMTRRGLNAEARMTQRDSFRPFSRPVQGKPGRNSPKGLHDNAETGKRRPEGFGMLRYRVAALQKGRRNFDFGGGVGYKWGGAFFSRAIPRTGLGGRRHGAWIRPRLQHTPRSLAALGMTSQDEERFLDCAAFRSPRLRSGQAP